MSEKYFYDWYQEPLTCLLSDSGTLLYLFGRFANRNNYSPEWAQQCLDFAYRVLKTKICEVYWDKPDNNKIILELSCNDPSNNKTISWDIYQFETTKIGEDFIRSCNISNDTEKFSPFFKEKLTKLFEEHGVGFDKSNFIPVQF